MLLVFLVLAMTQNAILAAADEVCADHSAATPAEVGQQLLQTVAQRPGLSGIGVSDVPRKPAKELAATDTPQPSNESHPSPSTVPLAVQDPFWLARPHAALIEVRGRLMELRLVGGNSLGMVLVVLCIGLACCGMAAFGMAFQMAMGQQQQQQQRQSFIDHPDSLPSGARSPRNVGGPLKPPHSQGFHQPLSSQLGTYSSNQSLPLPPAPLSPVHSAPVSRTPSETAISSAPLSTRAMQALCPGLVVPRENECLLAVPTMRTIGIPDRTRRASFDVRDMQGKAVISVEVSVPEWPVVASHAAAGGVDQMTIILRQARTPGNASPRSGTASPRGAGGVALAMARAVMEPNGQKSVLVFNASRDHFGRIVQASGEAHGQPFRYESLRSRSLFFEGDHGRYETRVVAPESVEQVLASTNMQSMPFDGGGAYYRLRVCQGADVGIMLIGLLAIELIRTF